MGTPLHSKWTAFILSIYPEDVSKPPDLLSKLLSHLFLSGVFGLIQTASQNLLVLLANRDYMQIQLRKSGQQKKRWYVRSGSKLHLGLFWNMIPIRFVWMHLSLDAKATQIGFLSVFCPLATLHKTTSYPTWSFANNSVDSLKLFEICLQIEQSLWHLSECPFCQIPTSQLANLKNNFRKGLKKTQRNNFSLFSGSRFHLGS